MTDRPTHASASSRAQAGFTLIELMVVVAMISILTSVAALGLKPSASPRRTATDLATRVKECTRLAVAGGPIRDDVLTALGSRARARVAIRYRSGGGQEVVVEHLEEDAAPSTGASWVEVSRSTVVDAIKIDGYRDSAELASTGGPDQTFTSGELDLSCYPDGTTDARTFYVDWDGSRVAADPGGGAADERTERGVEGMVSQMITFRQPSRAAGRVPAAARVPAPAPAPALDCPKCGGGVSRSDPACKSCGLARRHFAGYRPAPAAGDGEAARALDRLWAATASRWNDPAAHDAFLERVAAERAWSVAASRYRVASRRRPGDPVARARLAQVHRTAMALLQVQAVKVDADRSPSSFRGALMFLAVSLLAGVGALGLVHHRADQRTRPRAAAVLSSAAGNHVAVATRRRAGAADALTPRAVSPSPAARSQAAFQALSARAATRLASHHPAPRPGAAPGQSQEQE